MMMVFMVVMLVMLMRRALASGPRRGMTRTRLRRMTKQEDGMRVKQPVGKVGMA